MNSKDDLNNLDPTLQQGGKPEFIEQEKPKERNPNPKYKSKSDLDFIVKMTERTYSRWGNKLLIDKGTKTFGKDTEELGYCYMNISTDKKSTVYNIVVSDSGDSEVNDLIYAHEIGHIYLGHMSTNSREFEKDILDYTEKNRESIAERLNSGLGVKNGIDLIDSFWKRRELNRRLHNIAADLEVNSSIIMPGDVYKIEDYLTKQRTERLKSQVKGLEGLPDEVINKAGIVKLCLPEDYTDYLTGEAFPEGLTYREYLFLLLRNLDQFIKFHIKLTKGIGKCESMTSEELQDFLDRNPDLGESLDQQLEEMEASGGGSQSDRSRERNYSSGSEDGNGGEEGEDGEEKDGEGKGKDLRTPDKEEVDKEMKKDAENGLKKPGIGSASPKSLPILVINPEEGALEMALKEVLREFKSTTIKKEVAKDMMYKINRGINRKVISPTWRHKLHTSTEPKIVFLIDVSGSMNSSLVNRVIVTVAKQLRRLNPGMRYDIITWNTEMVEHMKGLDPRKIVPQIHISGGTRIGQGLKYFGENYDRDNILVVISDFEDYLNEWVKEEEKLKGYTVYGFNYGSPAPSDIQFKVLKEKIFENKYYD